MVQTLYKCAEEVAEKIGFLLVDECHRCPSRTFTEAVSAFDSRYMLGLTATPWRRDNLADLIFWHLGHLHHRIDKKELIASGDVLPAEIIYRQTKFEPFHDPVQEYSKMLVELTCDDERNRLIADDVAREARRGRGVCLVLSDRKSHCETLRALLSFKHKVPSEILTGDLSRQDRRQTLESIRQGRYRVLVATGQLMGEGIDCGQLTTLFLTTPIRFSGRLIQYLGRVLRPLPGKDKARVYDYVDTRVPTLVTAARARQETYSM
jgi:superfamily II DNA or RNA helicase